MNGIHIALGALLLLLSSSAMAQSDEEAIRGVLSAQQTAWNDGDIDTFMDGYWASDSLTFASGGNYLQGWQTTLERYKRAYPDRAAMGILTFTLYQVDVLSDDDAFVFGRYELERADDRPTGVFTLMLRKIDGEWKVVFDHTSAAPAESE